MISSLPYSIDSISGNSKTQILSPGAKKQLPCEGMRFRTKRNVIDWGQESETGTERYRQVVVGGRIIHTGQSSYIGMVTMPTNTATHRSFIFYIFLALISGS